MDQERKTLTLTPDDARDLTYGDLEGFEIIKDEIVENTRWSILHDLIVKKDDEFYLVEYSVGATEEQDERPFEYDIEVVLKQVFPVTKTIVVYE